MGVDTTKKPDFTGYATKAGLVCTDGRTITPDAFQLQHNKKVPLVWQHDHSDPTKILGEVILEHRDSTHPDGAGMYCYGYFNDTEAGRTSKALVHAGNITMLSIFANGLVERAKQVLHGAIREVSLVLAGANAGAVIDQPQIAHSIDAYDNELEEEAIIYTGLPIEHSDSDEGEEVVEHAEGDNKTYQDVYDNLGEDELELVHYMIEQAVENVKTGGELAQSAVTSEQSEGADGTESDSKNDDGDDEEEKDSSDSADSADSVDNSGDNKEGDLDNQEGTTEMTHTNLFEGTKADATSTGGSPSLSHDQLKQIMETGKELNSFKGALLKHAEEYGITNINLLFPEAKALTEKPEWISRRMEWVSSVLGGTKHSPFAKVKTILADITEPEARAKGYIKGNRKKEEVFKLLRRTTGPATIYKKQKLDRDDLLDITDIDVVNWLKAEMRLMIEEELARAILVGDGRSALNEDKVKDPEGALDGTGIRSILHDDELYAIRKELVANVSAKDSVKAIVRAMNDYRGSGSPVMYTSRANLTELLLDEDKFGRPLYPTKQNLADKLGVRDIIPVDLFTEYAGLFAIIVSLQDYTIGSNKGGELTSFEDFDIDFNQYKYLQETRLSGGLTKPFSAIVIMKEEGIEASPANPSFNGATDTIAVPTTTGVVYTIDDVPVTGDVVITEPTELRAEPATGYYFPAGTTTSWTFNP